MNQISFARAKTNEEYFMSGNILTFGKGGVYCMPVTNSKGFILSSSDADLCQTISHVEESTTASYSLTSLTYQTITLTTSQSSLSLSATAPTTTLIAQSKLYQVPNICCLFTGITPGVFPNQVYIMDFPEQQQTYPAFTT